MMAVACARGDTWAGEKPAVGKIMKIDEERVVQLSVVGSGDDSLNIDAG